MLQSNKSQINPYVHWLSISETEPNDVNKKTEDLGSRITITGRRKRGSSRWNLAKGDNSVADLESNQLTGSGDIVQKQHLQEGKLDLTNYPQHSDMWEITLNLERISNINLEKQGND